MAKSGNSRREYLALDAVDPTDGTRCKVQISFARMQTVARRSLGQACDCGYIVPEILLKPTAIFEGLRQEADEDRHSAGWRCYCGTPSCCYRPDGTKSNPWPGEVFLVFVNDERVAYNWRWEKADMDVSTLPINYKNRFKRRVL